MDTLIKSILLLGIALVSGTKMEHRPAEMSELRIEAIRHDNMSDLLQLNVSWRAEDALYEVRVHHVPTPTCSMADQDSPFQNQQDIKCAPILTETYHTSVLVPQDPKVFRKHVCYVLAFCTYRIEVKSMDDGGSLSTFYQVPECVEGICSCYYDKSLPNITSEMHIVDGQLLVNWSLGEYLETNLPHNVSLDHILVTVRRGLNEDLGWGGLESDKKMAILPPQATGSKRFNLSEFSGNKTIFVAHVRLFDSRSCYVEASPIRVLIPAKKTSGHILLVILLLVTAVGGLVAITLHLRRKYKRTRLGVHRPTDIYVQPSITDHYIPPPMQMVENRLYTDLEILDARARGTADLLEVPHSCLSVGREIGKGAFGRVFMACANKLPGSTGPVIVAIKQLKKSPKSDEFEEFLDEISMMKRVGRHPNIVTLLGCCTIKEPLTMIMEYIGCGDLLEYLRKIRVKHFLRMSRIEAAAQKSDGVSLQRSISNHSNSTVFGPAVKYTDISHTSSSNSDTSYITQPETILRPSLTETMYTTLSGPNDQLLPPDHPNSGWSRESGPIEYVLDHKELHDFARQISSGMRHLEEKQITHRDLAARNILIDERKTLKISDFGLSRSGIYVNTRNKKVPLRWLSLEAMRDNLYSSKSDVWAFGIVLWEIGTLGGYPYPTVSNHELLGFLLAGKRLERPENCTAELYNLMLKCWRTNPDERPSFSQISKQLEPNRHVYIDFNEIEPTYVFPPTSEEIRQSIANNK
ncbi:platelet-derived growth factor receptor alpha [Uranotaenia lowii]|uniref:platelet-derived growth factor receptor alpha n=1 Tax=Uranotaenia lowii TaxID=190385 RepID=UPI00247A878D|nr:platelet-derived growth factor receptor alpha [Uranotaenia lowii]XP_055601222.1 platelet-derived growth factor receptor alpha [Uranotaenia lowii]XP_055601223.1 platelet-derived growth factor receptor alpha [Uranotaenia lowii]